MNSFNPTNFLHSMAIMMAASSGLNYASGSPRQLWIHQAVEKVVLADGTTIGAGDPYSTLTEYGGPAMGFDPLPRASIQCRTIGTNQAATAAQAQKLFEALLDSDGYPALMKRIAGYLMDGTADGHYTLVSIEPRQRPAMMGPDDRNRANIVFNFDVGFFKAS